MSKRFNKFFNFMYYLFFVIYSMLGTRFLNTYFPKGSEFRLIAHIVAVIILLLLLWVFEKLIHSYKKKKGLL